MGTGFIYTTIALKSKDQVPSAKPIQKSHIFNLRIPKIRIEAETEEPEILEPASLEYTAQQQKQERSSFNKVEGKNQLLEVVL